MPEFAPAPLEVNAVYPSGRHVSTKLRTFVDFLQQRFKAMPAFSAQGLEAKTSSDTRAEAQTTRRRRAARE